MFKSFRKLTTRLFRGLTNNAEKNIALAIIESFEKPYTAGYKTYHRKELLMHLTSLIERSINTNSYNKLTWKQQDQVISMIITSMQNLANNSKNSATCYTNLHPGTGLDDPTYYDGEFRGAANIHQVKGAALLTREQEGWTYHREWNELKLPDIFYANKYDSKMQAPLKKAIFSALKGTKYNGLISNALQQLFNKTTTVKQPYSAVPVVNINYKEYENALNQLTFKATTPVLNIHQYKEYANALKQHGLLKSPTHPTTPATTPLVGISLRR